MTGALVAVFFVIVALLGGLSGLVFLLGFGGRS